MKLTGFSDAIKIQTKLNETTYRKADPTLSKSFDSALKSAIAERQEIKFSKHATERMMQRNISLTQPDMEKISEAVKRAGSKGIRDSLVLLDKIALIVNVPSKTVVTTVDEKSIKESVFTNIDGAVIM